MGKKPATRLHPFPTKKDLQDSFGLPTIATLFLLGSLLIAVLTRNGEAWVFCALVAGLYAYLASIWLPELVGKLRAYRELESFMTSSLTTTAEIVEKKVIRHASGDDFWLTLSYAARTRSQGVRGIKIYAIISYELYQYARMTIGVRYSILDPRIALLEGEAGFTDGTG